VVSTSRNPATWEAAERPGAADRLEEAGFSPLIAKLLARRGLDEAGEAHRFLHPELDHLSKPELLPDLRPAVEVLLAAREKGQRVAVVGDYDVDGVSATALLTAAFRARDLEVEPILPHRMQEGYGFQPMHAERALELGCRVIVTADCGTTAFEGVAAALEQGLEVIVTDHHLPGAPLPAGALHVNPRAAASAGQQASDLSTELSGAGVAFKLALAWGEGSGKAFDPRRLVGIAALGTIADMVPLVGENRVIAALGLHSLGETRSHGLRALILQSGVRSPIRASDVGFRMGPRLNAAGRLGSAEDALSLLLSTSFDHAKELAQRLDRLNKERQQEELKTLNDARKQVLGAGPVPKIVMAWSESWHQGVVGIAAGRLARELHRPVVLLNLRDGMATGSGRSVRGIHLHSFLTRWKDTMERFGGHSQAVGMTVAEERLDELRNAWVAAAEEWPEELLLRRHQFEAELSPREITEGLQQELEALEPFGEGNPRPLLKVGPMHLLASPRKFGNGHVSARAVGEDGGPLNLLGWNWGGRAAALDGRFEILAYLERDDYRGGSTLRLLDSRQV
jgi:single-stranded-DNA-specific exonuclease